MGCMNPQLIHTYVSPSTGEIVKEFVSPHRLWNRVYRTKSDFSNEFVRDFDINKHYKDVIYVNCGRCPYCASLWRKQLAQRARYEMLVNKDNCFVTLTVSDDYLDKVFPDGSLSHVEFQKFMKRLRIKLTRLGFEHKIKYLVSGEYGDLNGRPHFHVIFYGWKPHDMRRVYHKSKKGLVTYKSKFLEKVWSFGIVDIGTVTEKSAPYIAKYISKYKEVRKDEFTVNGKSVKKPYIVYPREMLGGKWFVENYKEIFSRGYLLASNGDKLTIPRSFIKFAEKREEMVPYLDIYRAKVEKICAEKKEERLQDLIKQGVQIEELGEVYHFELMLEAEKSREIWNSREVIT